MASAAAALIVRSRREIQHHFFLEDAIRPERAVKFAPSNAIELRQFEQMIERGSIKREGVDRYWIDVVAYDVGLQQRHRRVRTILLVLVLTLAVISIALGFADGFKNAH